MPGITRNKDDLTKYLENGQQVSTHWRQGRRYQSIHVQADPANKCIQLLDDKLRPITVEKLNQNLARHGLKFKTPDTTAQKTRRRIKNGQHQ